MLMTLYTLGCAAVVALSVLIAADKVRPSERATRALLAALNLLTAGGLLVTTLMLI